MKKFLSEILPIYAWIPTIVCVVFNLLSFYVTRPFTSGMRHYDLTTSFDSAIPFVPAFIVIYVLAFVQWALGYIAVGRESREFCMKFLSAMVIFKIICAVIFIVFPTTMTRPDVEVRGFFSWATDFIYSVDTPDNLFPSIHCAESFFFTVAGFCAKKVPKAYKWGNAVFTLLVFASVLLVKQHVAVDVLGGVVLMGAVLLISRLFRSERIFAFLNKTTDEVNN